MNHYEGPIAVFGDVRTISVYTNNLGAQYNLAGTSLNQPYPTPPALATRPTVPQTGHRTTPSIPKPETSIASTAAG